MDPWSDAELLGMFLCIAVGGCRCVVHGVVVLVLTGGGGVRVIVDAQGALVGGIPDAVGGGSRVVAMAAEISGA